MDMATAIRSSREASERGDTERVKNMAATLRLLLDNEVQAGGDDSYRSVELDA